MEYWTKHLFHLSEKVWGLQISLRMEKNIAEVCTCVLIYLMSQLEAFKMCFSLGDAH